MSVKACSTFEQNLGSDLLYGFLGPLNSLHFDLYLAKTQEEQFCIVQKFIAKHLPKKESPTVVDLQDEKIGELFDEAMQNMARDMVQRTIAQKKQLESLLSCATSLASLQESLRPKSWKDVAQKRIEKIGTTISRTLHRIPLVKQGLEATQQGLYRMGALSQESLSEEKADIVPSEEEEDWEEVETRSSLAEKILESWNKDPLRLLETQPAKDDLAYLRDEFLPKARQQIELLK